MYKSYKNTHFLIPAVLALVTAIVCLMSCSHQTQRLPAADANINPNDVRGLHGIDFSRWIGKLYSGKPKLLNPDSEFKNLIIKAYDLSLTQGEPVLKFYEALLRIDESFNFATGVTYNHLATALFAARYQLRNAKLSPELRASRQLLEDLAEEVLLAMVSKFPKSLQNSQWKMTFIGQVPESCVSNGQARSSDLNGFKICQGDVLVSKGSAGSSAFLARMTDSPGNFSHSTVAYVDPAKVAPGQNKKIWLAEAEIEDGVRLRDPSNDYIKNPKARLFIYRYSPAKDAKAQAQKIPNIIASVDGFVSEMKTLLKTRLGKEGDPTKDIVYPYDFDMNPKDSKALFCSEVTMYSYTKNQEANLVNPYPEANWSHVTGITEEFFKKFLNIQNNAYPGPADVEFNSNFQLVGFSIDTKALQRERIDSAMIDTLLTHLQINGDKVQKVLDKIAPIGNSSEQVAPMLDLLAKRGFFPADKIDKIKASVPMGANPKQLIFFGFINEKLTPAVRKVLIDADNNSLKNLKQPLSPHDLRRLAMDVVDAQVKALVGHLQQLP